ncbi:MAG: four helix bundle protein [Patescibacteria group bacterium]
MDVAGLWITDLEMVVAAMHIFLFFKILTKHQDIIHQSILKLLHVLFLFLSSQKFFPSEKQILDRNDILKAMSELGPSDPPRRSFLPVIEYTVSVYKLWYEYREHFPKKSRFTLGEKIDTLFVQILELLFVASYQAKDAKLPTLMLAVKRLDTLKFFVRISWELQALDTKKYIALSEKLEEVGKMLGGWKKGLETKTPSK